MIKNLPPSICWIAAFLLLLASCASDKVSQEPKPETSDTSDAGSYILTKLQFESSGMKLGKMAMHPFHEVIRANGMLAVPPENQVSVSSYFGGTVKHIRLLPGERVQKGQLLFILENPEFVQLQQDFLEAKGQLAYLKSDYERQKNLAQDNVSSQKRFLKAESDYTVTQVRVQSIGRKLGLMNIDPATLSLENLRTSVDIRSPIQGYVTRVNVTRGSYLNPAQAALTLVDITPLHLELQIFEKDLPRVSPGQSVQFRIQGAPGKAYSAEVQLVNKAIDPEDRTIGVLARLRAESLPAQFSPGMYVEADIFLDSASQPALPEDALVEIEGKNYVLVLDKAQPGGYSFLKKEVETGAVHDGFVEILNPGTLLQDSAKFLTRGAFNLITE